MRTLTLSVNYKPTRNIPFISLFLEDIHFVLIYQLLTTLLQSHPANNNARAHTLARRTVRTLTQ